MGQVSTGKILEDSEIPVWVITFSTQEMLVFRNAATREVVVGAENRVEQCTYAAVITRVESELGNQVTGGWKVVEASHTFYFTLLRLWLTFEPADGSEVVPCIFIAPNW